MSEPLDSLVRGWKQHFASTDSSIKWLHSELELEVELAPGVWLVGCVDAVGESGGELFFGEWKTANPRERKTWKQVWRMNPQSLSYGLLIASQPQFAGLRRYTVRKAFKEQVPTYDHAWFRYDTGELNKWKTQLIQIGEDIRWLILHRIPWEQNFSRCFRYGVNYACPFFECSCNVQQYSAVPAGSTIGGDPTWSATNQRARIVARDPNAVVLSATTVADWLDCREMYRRKYVELVTPAKNEAVLLGGNFHHELGQYYAELSRTGTLEAANGSEAQAVHP